jgi:hypothetical protein
MPVALRFKRGTKAQIDTAAGSSGLVAGEPYLITDQGGRLAVGTTTSAYVMAQIRGLSSFCSGTPGASEVVGGGVAPYPFSITAANCAGRAGTASTGSTAFIVRNNGTQIGTMTFAAGASTATVSITTANVAVGDLITIHAPATPDTTLANLTFLLRE